MTDEEFTAAVERLEGDRSGQFGVKVAREAIRRLEESEAVLRQIGWLEPGNKKFLSLLLNDTQFAMIERAIESFNAKATGLDVEESIAGICDDWHRRATELNDLLTKDKQDG